MNMGATRRLGIQQVTNHNSTDESHHFDRETHQIYGVFSM